jgi:hypothetical protein
VTVVLAGPALERRVVTDSNGTFFLAGPPAVYSLTATLPGFDSFELRGITVEAGRHVDLNITLQLGCITPDLYIDNGLVATVKATAAVLLFRVSSTAPPAYRRLGHLCGDAYEYTATTIEMIKGIDLAAATTFTFVEFGGNQLELDGEYLGIFDWVPSAERFHPYRSYIARVAGGEVQCGGTNLPCGPVADVIATLRNLAAR